MGDNKPADSIALTPGKRVLFLTKDLDLIKKQLYDGLDLRMEDLTCLLYTSPSPRDFG